MWVDRKLFDRVLEDNKAQQDAIVFEKTGASRMSALCSSLREQKAKDDITIDWMRHRVNALEKQNMILMGKATGLHFPVPEIVPTRPGTFTTPPDFDTMPSFEDVGDVEAARLKVRHTDDGTLQYE